MSGNKTASHAQPSDSEVAYALNEIHDLSHADYSAVTRDCDLVMKGGITSGVVYPLTICRLATSYRLRSIGGTSAGAIAAGAAAAAEHRRQTASEGDTDAGYRRLAEMPGNISPKLSTLFQARPDTRRLFGILHVAIDPDKGGFGRAAAVVGHVISGKAGWFAVGFLATLALVVPGLLIASRFPLTGGGVGRILIGLILPAVLAFVVGTVLAAIGFVREAGRVLPKTGYGLTDGATHDDTPALTDWMADELDLIAGIGPGECLTLGDLWGEEAIRRWKQGSDADWVKLGPAWRARSPRRISLEIMTTDLTLRRPFRMPFDTHQFMFSKAEWSALFPERVVATMARDEFRTEHRHPETGELLYRFPGSGSLKDPSLPGPEFLPVVVMVRMSLSFPGLISAADGNFHWIGVAAPDNGDFAVAGMTDTSNLGVHRYDASGTLLHQVIASEPLGSIPRIDLRADPQGNLIALWGGCGIPGESSNCKGDPSTLGLRRIYADGQPYAQPLELAQLPAWDRQGIGLAINASGRMAVVAEQSKIPYLRIADIDCP